MGVWPTTTEKSCNKVSRWVRFGQLLEVNFVQKLHISNHLPKRIFTKSCREGPSFVGCTFLIHSLFFPAFPSSFSDLPLLLSLFSWSISIPFSLLRIHILSTSSSAFMLYSPTEQPIGLASDDVKLVLNNNSVPGYGHTHVHKDWKFLCRTQALLRDWSPLWQALLWASVDQREFF